MTEHTHTFQSPLCPLVECNHPSSVGSTVLEELAKAGEVMSLRAIWAMALVVPISAEISEKLGSSGDFTHRNSPCFPLRLGNAVHRK